MSCIIIFIFNVISSVASFSFFLLPVSFWFSKTFPTFSTLPFDYLSIVAPGRFSPCFHLCLKRAMHQCFGSTALLCQISFQSFNFYTTAVVSHRHCTCHLVDCLLPLLRATGLYSCSFLCWKLMSDERGFAFLFLRRES